MIREVLDGKGEIPLILIVGVSVCGTVLLLLNIVLVSCFVHKKKKKEEAEHGRKMAGGGGGGGGGGGSDGKASRTADGGHPGEGVLLTSISCGFRLTLYFSCTSSLYLYLYPIIFAIILTTELAKKVS